MSGLFSSGGTTSTKDTVINSMQIQQSTYGLCLTIPYGTNRLAGNVIGYDDLKHIPHTTSSTSGGKGGGETTSKRTTYTYTVALIIALGEGVIKNILQVWDGNTITTLEKLELDFYPGTLSQTAWPYMITNHPEKAIPYRGVSYVAAAAFKLGDTTSLSNLTFEANGILSYGIPSSPDAIPTDIIIDLLTNSQYGAGFPAVNIGDLTHLKDYVIAAGIFISPFITTQKNCHEYITDISQITNSQPVWSQGKLKMIPYSLETLTGNGVTYSASNSPIYSLDDSDFIVGANGDPIEMTRSDTADAYNIQQLEYSNRNNSYNTETVEVMDLANIELMGPRTAEIISYDGICVSSIAKTVAQNILNRRLYNRNVYKFTLSWKYCLLDPMDLVALTNEFLGLDDTLVRITEIEDSENEDLIFTVEEVYGTTSGVTLFPSQDADRTTLNYGVSPGNVNKPIIFNPPEILTTTGYEAWMGVCGGDNWSGCNVWISDNNVSYVNVGRINNPIKQGVLTSPLPVGVDPDTTNLLSVDTSMSKGELNSGTRTDANNFNTLCYVDGELVSYETSTLTGGNKYNLSYLRRGVYGTSISRHESGSQFSRVDKSAMFVYPFVKERLGSVIYIKLTSINVYGAAEQSLAEVDTYTHTLTAQLPPNVSNISMYENTFILKDGTALSDILVTFTEPLYGSLGYYNIYYNLNNGGWQYSGTAKDGKGYTIKSLPQAKSVRIKVTIVSKFLLESGGTISSAYDIVGKSDPPPDVVSLGLAQDEYNRANIILTWTPLSRDLVPDLKGYEARLGSGNWEDALKINSDTIVGNTFSYVANHNGNYTFLIKAIDNSGNYSTNIARKDITINVVPDTPTKLKAVQEPRDRSMVKITWDSSPGKDISGYELRYGNSWDTSTLINIVKESTFWWFVPASGTYNIMIQAKTVAGYVSNIANKSITAMIEAYDVTGFGATQSMSDRTKVTLMWDTPLSLDVSYFIIKKGPSWDDPSTVTIGQRVTGTFYEILVKDENPQTLWIKAVSIAGKESQTPAKVEGIYNMNPDPVTNIQISQNVNDKSVVNITWTGISESDLTGYQVAIGYVWDTAIKLPLTQELKTTYSPATTGDLKVMIKSVNAAGYYSDEASTNQYVTLEPAKVTGLQILQNGEYVEIFWDKHHEPDVVAYEIREGASFDTGTLVASGVTINSYAVKVDVERNYLYNIKAINRANKYSQQAIGQGVAVANLPPKNVILTYDDIALQNGVATNVEFGSSLINWSNIGGKWSDYPTTKFSDIGGRNVLKLKKTGSVYPVSGTYTCQTVDVGQVVTANISIQFISSVVLRGIGSAVLQIRTSRDGTTWTAWQDFRPAQYTFRYLDRRVVLGTTDTAKTPEVNQFVTKIDVDDTDDAGSIVVPVGGCSVLFKKIYYNIPTLTPTALGANRFYEITNKNKSGFTVKIVDRAGNDVGGNLDWRARGY